MKVRDERNVFNKQDYLYIKAFNEWAEKENKYYEERSNTLHKIKEVYGDLYF
jgi:hypothetical protein